MIAYGVKKWNLKFRHDQEYGLVRKLYGSQSKENHNQKFFIEIFACLNRKKETLYKRQAGWVLVICPCWHIIIIELMSTAILDFKPKPNQNVPPKSSFNSMYDIHDTSISLSYK